MAGLFCVWKNEVVFAYFIFVRTAHVFLSKSRL